MQVELHQLLVYALGQWILSEEKGGIAEADHFFAR
jgi:hypothetical protein